VQDRYAGDVGDFGKYGLLRALCKDDLSLGVVWYLVPDEEGTGDGGHVGVLGQDVPTMRKYMNCGPSSAVEQFLAPDAGADALHGGAEIVVERVGNW